MAVELVSVALVGYSVEGLAGVAACQGLAMD